MYTPIHSNLVLEWNLQGVLQCCRLGSILSRGTRNCTIALQIGWQFLLLPNVWSYFTVKQGNREQVLALCDTVDMHVPWGLAHNDCKI